MNIFSKILGKAVKQDTRLGNPLGVGNGPFFARMNCMALMRGGNGFQTPPRDPFKDSQGMTRGDRKRMARATCNNAERARQRREFDALVEPRMKKADVAALRLRFGSLSA